MGRRVLRQLAWDPEVTRLVAIDRDPLTARNGIEVFQLDLLEADLAAAFAGLDTVVHLAEESRRPEDGDVAERILRRVLGAASDGGCHHLVVLSSATVYGARADNPVPLIETQAVRPNPDLAFAVTKQRVERLTEQWVSADALRSAAVLRPTVTLSEGGASWVAKSLRAAATVRPDRVDPPVQFLHHDDLASAVSMVARQRLDGVFNVAPDGWIGPEAFRELSGGLQVRVPIAVSDRLLRAGRRFGVGSTPPGIEPYVRHSWVVANDRLRLAGWTPVFSNEEAYVLGTPPPPWSVSAQRRQELALGAASIGVAGVAAAAAAVTRRWSR